MHRGTVGPEEHRRHLQQRQNPILYAILFLMLLRCDLKKILKLGPKMLVSFFAASVSIGLGFVASFAIFKGGLGPDAWKSLIENTPARPFTRGGPIAVFLKGTQGRLPCRPKRSETEQPVERIPPDGSQKRGC